MAVTDYWQFSPKKSNIYKCVIKGDRKVYNEEL